ncbi:hypothetical protein FNW25_01405 [Flavobacterium franklandianum]|uniref:replication initiation factor domain-containing protein n=1 Tax=Flavobacterium franklandianum TaxID=2594430 RepID=UPI001179CF3D|nr:hypothetical protein [Flavobacterium franklandianum]TRX29643.1 hypothetical protein FNW25_01405 [Flavobacterium franklandianum]
MITYKQRHSKKNFKPIKDNALINIDYLIINLDGNPFGDFPENSNFKLNHYDYGTKIFASRSDLYFKNEKIGTLQHSPRSAILDVNFAQLQFENHLFYTHSHQELKTLLIYFLVETDYSFKAINRLDICIDKNDKNHNYRNIYDNIIKGDYLISGRPKNLQSYFETYKGKSVLNGFQIGKRTSDKIIRVYNKTLSLQLTEKPYINDFFINNGVKNENIWRFEYQLNSAFFRHLKEIGQTSKEVIQDMTWGIFNKSTLFELLKIATKGFFELHENTGKSQINKEKKIDLFDFDSMRNEVTKQTTVIKKIKNGLVSSITIKKRLAKSLFREYYANEQDISYIVALNLLLEDTDYTTDKKLKVWFLNKMNFYLHEFRNKEKIKKHFYTELFQEHCNFFMDTIFTKYVPILQNYEPI